jgi:AcrR family transcriptional regulator
MARTFNEQEYALKRKDILDAAQRLIFTKGYVQMTVQDILDKIGISSGAFYHYFGSKQAVLEALIERMLEEGKKPLLSLVQNPGLSALEKLQNYFATIDRLRVENRTSVVGLLRIWYTDDNALLRQRAEAAAFELRVPLLTEIIREGVQEGSFKISFPEQAGEIVLSLLQGMGNTHARQLLSLGPAPVDQDRIDAIVAIHAAYMDAIERVLGVQPGCFYRADAEAVKAWADAL